MDAYLHTEPEQHYVKPEVYGMGTRETHEMFPRWLLMESEATGGIVVDEKTNNVTYGIGSVYLNN